MQNNKNKEALNQKKLLELHRIIIALEKLEIRRKESTINSREMRSAFRDLINELKSPILIIQNRKIVFLSPSLARLLGYPPKKMLGTSFASYIHPSELFKIVGYYLRRISGEEAPVIYNSILKRRDGKEVRVEIMAGIFPYFEKPADLVIVKELGG